MSAAATDGLAQRAALANAFLYRCAGMADLSLGYVKDALRLATDAAGRPPLPPPPRGEGERLLDFLDAARAQGMETAEHLALRAACDRIVAKPPPLLDMIAEFQPVTATDEPVSTATRLAYQALNAHHRGEDKAAEAGYRFALLVNPIERLAHYNLGVIYVHREEWDLATEHLEQVLALDPTNFEALSGLHNIALRANRMNQLAPRLKSLLEREELPSPDHRADGAPDLSAPIIALDTENGDDVGALVLKRGVAHVRAATLPDAVAELHRVAVELFQAHSPRLSLPLVEAAPAYRDPGMLLSQSMTAVLNRIFGRAPRLSITDTYLRLVTPDVEGTYIPFHQDVTALATTGVNVWVPLIDCGEDAPSLELMAQRTSDIFPTVASHGDYNQMEIAAEAVYAAFPPELRFYPTPKVGDAVLFLGGTVHRSHIAPGMTRTRMSLEMRFY